MTVSLWYLMRPLPVFLLITAFLVLSYCPLRRDNTNYSSRSDFIGFATAALIA